MLMVLAAASETAARLAFESATLGQRSPPATPTATTDSVTRRRPAHRGGDGWLTSTPRSRASRPASARCRDGWAPTSGVARHDGHRGGQPPHATSPVTGRATPGRLRRTGPGACTVGRRGRHDHRSRRDPPRRPRQGPACRQAGHGRGPVGRPRRRSRGRRLHDPRPRRRPARRRPGALPRRHAVGVRRLGPRDAAVRRHNPKIEVWDSCVDVASAAFEPGTRPRGRGFAWQSHDSQYVGLTAQLLSAGIHSSLSAGRRPTHRPGRRHAHARRRAA